MDIQQLKTITRTITVPIEGEAITVTYRLGALNLQFADWLREHRSDRGSLMGWVERVCTSWNITDGGQPIPITMEAMERYGLPAVVVQLIIDEIYTDASPAMLKESFKRPASDVSSNVTRSF